MKIQRNIHKQLPITPTTSVSQPSSLKARSTGLGKYRFPQIDDVPGGYYISRIMHIKDSPTKRGNTAVEVFYKLLPLQYCYQVVNNMIAEDPNMKPYYIRQKYPKNSIFYDAFIDKMFEALELDDEDELDLNEVIGLEEKIQLSYTSETAFGGITDRVACSLNDLIIDDYDK